MKFIASAVAIALTVITTGADANTGRENSRAKKTWDSLRADGISTHQTRASEFNSRFGRHYSGGQMSLRIRQSRARNVAVFAPPSLSGGCSGIDFYAGSFSLLSGDEIVQMYRGAMQGAASYFFSISLQSLCPSCHEIASSIQDKIEEMNKFLRTDCQSIVNSEWGQSVEAGINRSAETARSWLRRDSGIDDGHGPVLGEDSSPSNTPLPMLEIADTNIALNLVRSLNHDAIGTFGPFFNSIQGEVNTGMADFIPSPIQQGMGVYLMSVLGTFTIQAITDEAECQDRRNAGESCTDINEVAPTMSFGDIAFGLENGFTYNVCEPDTNRCSSVTTQSFDTEFLGLIEYIKELIGGGPGGDGLLQMLHRTWSTNQITASAQGEEIEQLLMSTSQPWVRYAQITMGDRGYDIETIAHYVALRVTDHYMYQLKSTLDRVLAQRKSVNGDVVNLTSYFERMEERLDRDYRQFKAQLEHQQEAISQQMQLNAQMMQILRGE